MSEQAILELAEQLARKVVEAHDSMFGQCCSNPIYNSWGAQVDVSLINDTRLLADRFLSVRKEQ
ncbi:hypothetical protein [Aeromonas salmonicida]|uniref:hypothetical protein n=1 Tax=Aeromonas salmonicida TaxID=645 RepID=UPI001F336F16|nr:hypothetical protein [Aeromonas salmonicida]MCE9932703.1 hypothetical protein [Aeromonas salmonicida]